MNKMNKKFTKLIAAFALLVFMMPSMAGWGQTRTVQTASYGFESGDAGWTETTFVTNNTAITAHGGSKYGATNGSTADVKFNTIVERPLSLTCYYSKTTTNTNAGSHFEIQVSTNNSTWTMVASGLGMDQVTKGTWYELTADLSSYSNVYVRVRYDGTTGVRALDDITLTYDDGQSPSTDPVISFSPTSVSLDDVLVNNQASTTFTVSQSNLEAGITLSVDNGELSQYSIDKDADPTSITWTYTPTAAGSISATVTAISGETTQTLSIIGTAIAPIEGYDVDFEYATNMYPNWTFDNMTTYQTGSITAHGGTYYGTTGGKATASITTTSSVANPGTLTCYVSKQSGNTSSSTWYIQVSSDGSTWTNVESQSATSMAQGTWVEFTADLTSYTNVYVRVYYSGSTAVRNIDDLTLTISNSFTVTYNANGATSGTVPTDSNEYESGDEVTVLDNTGNLAKAGYTFGGWNTQADGDGTNYSAGSTFTISANTTLYAKWNAKTITGLSYTGTPNKTTYSAGESFDPTGLTVTATFNDESSENVTALVTWTPDPLTTGTTSVTGTYMEQTINVTGLTVTAAAGSAENPYTVAQAIAATPASGTSANVYIHGIVSSFYNTSIMGDGSNYRYYISDDGTTTNQLLVYKGKGLNNVAFSNVDDLLVGDVVTICGGLTTYSNAPEIAANNYIVSLVRKVATPTFSPAAGSVIAGTTVTITSATNGATIYYTTDGTEPSTNSTEYTEPITITEAITIKAFAVKADNPNSDIATAEYTIAVPVATPTFSPAPGTYTSAQNVTIACTTEGATIYYTTDGTDPTTESTEYTAAIPVATTTTIKAIAVKAGMANSEIATVTYTISIPAITLNSYSIEAPEAGDSGILEATYHNITDVAAEVWFCNAEGTEEAEYSWISASINDDNDIAYTINSNNGDARTAYFKVWAYDDSFNEVYSDLVTVSQEAYVPKYTVTFTVNGGDFVPNGDFEDEAVEKEGGIYHLPSATKTGFTFDGWNDGNATYEADAEYTVSGDVNFTAQWTEIMDATISFNNTENGTAINTASVTGNDNMGNAWTITTEGTSYFYAGYSYCQVGSGNNPATSITFTTTLAHQTTITAFEAKFGGFNGTAGTVTLKVGDKTVGSGSLNESTDVTVSATNTTEVGTVLTVTLTNIAKGVKCFYISYTISNAPIINPTVDLLAYDATSGTITYEIDNYVAGTIAAATEADWITGFTYEQVNDIGEVVFTTTANELYESREATVTLTFTYGTDKTVTKDVTVTQDGAPIPTYIVSFVVGEGETFVPNEDFDVVIVEVKAGTYTLPLATKEGYTFNGWSDGEQTYAVGASYTVSDDVEFTATYTELPKYTITFYVNGNLDESITIPNIVEGNGIALPTSSTFTPAGFEISGWALENTTTAVADPYTPTANVTLYALLQLENMPTSEYYAKVTEELTDWSGEYLIVYEEDNIAFNGNLETIDAVENTVAVDIEQSTIVASTNMNNAAFKIAPITDRTNSYSIQCASGKYIGATSYANSLVSSDDPIANSISIDESGNALITVSTPGGDVTLKYNSASNQLRFRYYKSGQQDIQLYKKVAETPASFNNVIVLEESQQMADNIPANTCVVVEDGVILTFSGVNQGTASNLVIKDGGQLKVYASGAKDGGVQATVEKSISAWTTGTPVGGWYFIASPINADDLNPEVVDNLITDDDEDNSHTFDLYKYVADNMDNEGLKPWYNYRAHSGDFVLANGQGYLYANASDQTLAFAGAVKPYSEENNANQVAVDAGWNLIGNPFTFNTYVNQSYYKLNNDRTAIEAVNNNAAIAPCTGIIVKAENSGNVTFSETASGGSKGSVGIMLSKAGTRSNATLDNAIVSFNEGSQLEKFYFMQQNANLYIPQGKEEYAIVNAQAQGEMPVNFRANTNGQYTLTVNAENVEMNYLHLIDNMTGADIDLLQTPSYTFNAKTYDYESRFRLVFAANSNDNASAGSETFAFFANGNLIINNEGEATLQVIDMTGRVLRSEAINGSANIGTKGLATGVYVLRLVNGNNIKTQKMVMK